MNDRFGAETEGTWLSINKLLTLWPDKSYEAMRKMIHRNKVTMVRWFRVDEAQNAGLEWKINERGGKEGNQRLFIHISDPAIPSFVKLNYHQSFCETNRSSIISSNPSLAFNHPDVGIRGVPPCYPHLTSGTLTFAGLDSQDQLSEPEIDRELYARAAHYERKKADKYLAHLERTNGLKGNDLKEAINGWNMTHPDQKTSYVCVLGARKAYEDNGISGLLAQYGKSSKSTIKDEWFESFKNLYLKEGSPSVRSCWIITLGEAAQRDPSITASSFPSPVSFLRRLKKEVPESTLYLKRRGYQAWTGKYAKHVDRDYSEVVPGEVYVADHAQIDVAVMSPTGKVCFPWITAISDFKSNKYVGWDLHIESPNSDHIFQAAFRAFTDFGIPSEFLIDNGKDFRCHDFSGGRKNVKVKVDEIKTTSLLSSLNIKPNFAKPYGAQTKPIERTFLRNKEWFSKHMPGYRGGNVRERPEVLKEEIKQGKILPWEQFKNHVDEFITTVANRMSSDGKNLKGMSPDELWNKEAKIPVKVKASSLKLLCMRSSRPIEIGRNGVRDSKFQVTYWGEWMSGRKGEHVYLRRDNRAFQTAWVFSADGQDRYIGEASIAEQTTALARTDIDKEKLKEALAGKNRDQKVAQNGAGIIQRIPAADIIKSLALGAKLLNDKRGYAPGDDEETKVIEVMPTCMDDVMRQREEQRREGTSDLSAIAPPMRSKKKILYVFKCDKEDYEKRAGEQAQNFL
jgi:hypothetical protein